jgi:glycosyltransferase involved in cell wall biosynthesis
MTAASTIFNQPASTAAVQTAAPAVSVLMAVYNGKRYLPASIESILAQSFRDFEFIIIDDGSTDGSSEIVADFARQDPRIRVIVQQNIGLTKSLNKAIALARGRYIARMDSDDIALPARFEQQVAFLDQHPEHVMIGSQVLLIDPDGDPICEKPQTQYGHDPIQTALLEKGWPMVHPAVMIRTETLRTMGGYDERYRTNQDHDLFLRLCERGKVENLPDVLLQYRQHFASVVFKTGIQQSDVLRAILREAWARRGKPMPTELESPTGKKYERMEQYREWFWAALSAGHRKTARKYARAIVIREPWKLASWKLVYFGLAGKPRRIEDQ